jgi:HEAT repeat protein
VGNDSCVDTLLEATFADDADLAQAARNTLAELPGKTVEAKIVEQLSKADAKRLPQLLALVGQRRIAAVPTLVKSLDHADQEVRIAALTALGETVELAQLNILLERVLSPKNASDTTAAQTALKAASVRMPDRNACAAELAKALAAAPDATKVSLLELLGEVGGETALATLAQAAKSNQPELQDAGSRVLGKWNGTEVAPVLLDLAKTGPVPQYRTRALRGYLGIARKFAMPDDQRAAMCSTALGLSQQAAEQKLVLDVLKIHPNPATLAVAIQAMEMAGLKDDAAQAVMLIAQKMKTKGPEVAAMLAKAGFPKVKVEILKAEYGAGKNQRDVTTILQKQIGELPLITLPASSYNASFGGDPAANQVKALKIQYRLNGKAGEASFAEDAVILLPTP